MNTTNRTLVLFDFDGTITNKDSLFVFTRFAKGNFRFFFSMLYLALPMVLQKINLLTAQHTKEVFLAHFFRNKNYADFKNLCFQFKEQALSSIIRPKALSAILSHKQAGDRILIVSASPQDWIIPWATQFGIEVLATQLEIQDDRLTGRIIGKNCNGIEKVNRISQHVKLSDYKQVIAYGDSAGDHQMFELARKKNYKPFR